MLRRIQNRLKHLFLMTFSIAVWAQSPPVFRTNSRVVEVTIVATGPGELAVRDLRANELSLFDNKKFQTIASFENLSSDLRVSGSSGALEPALTRVQPPLMIVLDGLNTGWGAQIYGREAVGRLLETLAPKTRVALFAFGNELRLLHALSSNLASVRAALAHYQGEQPLGGIGKHAGAVDPLSAQFSGEQIAERKGRKPDPIVRFYQERRIFTTLDALTAIAQIAKRASGRKNLVWISAGFPLGSHREDAAKAVRELSSAGIVLYAIDPRGLLLSSAAEATDFAMNELTEQTGGRTFYNNNDLLSLARAALDDFREGYSLTYVPSDYLEDGSYHELHLKTSRKGVQLRYRTGYFADSAAVGKERSGKSEAPR
jgi:VWFA-related protein